MRTTIKWSILSAMAVLACFSIRPAIARIGFLPAVIIAQPGISHLEETENFVFDMTNKMRREHGLKKLKKEDVLRITSREHSADMISRNYFDHNNPDGLAPEDRIAIRHRRLVGLTGENIWNGYGYDINNSRQIAELIMTGWMNSPGHRANILRAEYTHLGVGVSTNGHMIMATQNFAAVLAYIDSPVPALVNQNASLNLKAGVLSGSVRKPTKYDFWISQIDRQVAGPFPIADAKAAVAPGIYKLRFYFPDKSGYSFTIYTGPQIKVE